MNFIIKRLVCLSFSGENYNVRVLGGFILQKVQARNKLEKCLINFGQKLAIRAIVEWQKNCPIVPLPGCTFSHHLIGKWIPGKGMIIKIVPNGNMQSSSCLKIFENQIRVYLLQCQATEYLCIDMNGTIDITRELIQKKKSMKMQTVENEIFSNFSCMFLNPNIFFKFEF